MARDPCAAFEDRPAAVCRSSIQELSDLTMIERPARTRYFFNRLMLTNTMVVLVATLIYALVASVLVIRSEQLKTVQRYEIAAKSLFDAYNAKHNSFSNCLYPVYRGSSNSQAVRSLIEDSTNSLFQTSAYLRQDLIRVLQEISDQDNDIVSVMITNIDTRVQYIYDQRNNVLRMQQDSLFFHDETPDTTRNTQRISFGSRELLLPGQTSASINGGHPAFGIAGTLENRPGDRSKPSVRILLAYDQRSFDRLLQPGAGDIAAGRLLLMTFAGQVIYDTDPGKGLPDLSSDQEGESLTVPAGRIVLDGQSWLSGSLKHDQRQFAVIYLVPAVPAPLLSNLVIVLILAGSLLFSLLSVGIYILAARLSSRRIRQLETGMQLVGRNNLDYRIRTGTQRDEYAQIASHFNAMCDDLQETIRRVYLYEIKQKQTELSALQANINPHFLYNTLEAVRNRVAEAGDLDTAEMIVLLSRLFRYQIKSEPLITIEEEIRQCQLYVDLFSLRYDSSFTCTMDIAPEIMGCGIPKNTLQPVLENYFIHGIRDASDNHLHLSGTRDEADIVFRIKDNGRGMSHEQVSLLRGRLDQITASFTRTGLDLPATDRPADHVSSLSEGTSGAWLPETVPDGAADGQRSGISPSSSGQASPGAQILSTPSPGGIGLVNVQERLLLIYGPESGIALEETQGGVTIIIRMRALTLDDLKALLSRSAYQPENPGNPQDNQP